MQVIGTVGLPGSGKGEAATVAREEGIPVVTMGDVVRAATRERGLDPAEHHGEVARALREEEGPAAIAERSLPLIREAADAEAAGADAEAEAEGKAAGTTVLVDGLRSPVEVETFEAAFGSGFLVVSVEAPFETRAARLGARERDDSDADSEALREREGRELGFGMGEVMDDADVVVENDATLEAFRERIRRLLREGPAALVDDPAAEVAIEPTAWPDGSDENAAADRPGPGARERADEAAPDTGAGEDAS
jgi:dephospho-CoA kinase